MTMDKKQEWNYILKYICTNFENTEILEKTTEVQQLRCLWTTLCLHNNIEPDTYEYDTMLMEMWTAIRKKTNTTFSKSKFDHFDYLMCKYLV